MLMLEGVYRTLLEIISIKVRVWEKSQLASLCGCVCNLFSVYLVFVKSKTMFPFIPDSSRRTQYIYAKVKIGVTTTAVRAHARSSPPEHLPAVRMRERQAVPRPAARRLRSTRREPYMPMMNLYCDPVTLLFIDAFYFLSQVSKRYVHEQICNYISS